MVVDLPSNNKHLKKMFVQLRCPGGIGASMKWRVANDGPNWIPEATTVEHESFKKVKVQTFFGNFVEDDKQLKEFWPFHLGPVVVEPENLRSPTRMRGL